MDLWSPLPDMHPYQCFLANLTRDYETMLFPLYSTMETTTPLSLTAYKTFDDPTAKENQFYWETPSLPTFLSNHSSLYQMDIDINHYLDVYQQNATGMIVPSIMNTSTSSYDLYTFNLSDYLAATHFLNVTAHLHTTKANPELFSQPLYLYPKNTSHHFLSHHSLYYKPRHLCRSILNEYSQNTSIFTNLTLSYEYTTCQYKHIHIPSRHLVHYLYPELDRVELCLPAIHHITCAVDNSYIHQNSYYKKTLEPYIEVEYNQTDAGKNYYRIKREGLKRLRYQYKEFITTNKMILQMNVNLSSSHSLLSSACVHVYIHKYPL